MPVKPIPDGFHTVTPYLVVRGVPAFLDFLQRAFAAELKQSTAGPGGAIQHAQVRIGTSMLMMGEARDPHTPMPAMLYLYLPDVDAAYKRALDAGGESILAPMDMFYGDRNGAVKDVHGNQWWMATHIEDVPDDELASRAAAAKH